MSEKQLLEASDEKRELVFKKPQNRKEKRTIEKVIVIII